MKSPAVILLAALVGSAVAFQPLPATLARARTLKAEDDETFFASSKGRIGSSVDQDGKSNVWAVEPKMQVEVAQEGEGMMKGGIIAGGAAAAFALAGLIVANLPDVDAL
eukprot:CAMPEP_0172616340 /NCGR_PEP_ID=MMETSP1068-20121228/63791_1 /TAXON_ID=35684 /ORGANISM="Pseudopedinella elastica, Strain CCMP716" /LENGTH=108 /DNA_ID=CAMNT_0013421737 /DNA_START=62 /DNA_END=388 /DNA_ORIENTATION=+